MLKLSSEERRLLVSLYFSKEAKTALWQALVKVSRIWTLWALLKNLAWHAGSHSTILPQLGKLSSAVAHHQYKKCAAR